MLQKARLCRDRGLGKSRLKPVVSFSSGLGTELGFAGTKAASARRGCHLGPPPPALPSPAGRRDPVSG